MGADINLFRNSCQYFSTRRPFEALYKEVAWSSPPMTKIVNQFTRRSFLPVERFANISSFFAA